MTVVAFHPQQERRIEIVRVRLYGKPAWLFDAIERDRLGRGYRRSIACIHDDASAIDHAGDLRRQGYVVVWEGRP